MILDNFHQNPASHTRDRPLWDPISTPRGSPPDPIIQVSIRSYVAKEVSKIIYWFI